MMLRLTLHMQGLYNIYIQELVSIHMYIIYCIIFSTKEFFQLHGGKPKFPQIKD